MSSMAADWSNLPWPALSLIPKFLTFSVDYVRFRSVCTSWRSSAPKRFFPPFVVGHHVDSNGLLTVFKISNFDGVQDVPIPELPESYSLNAVCCGASRGWLAFLDPTPGIFLWNPITNSHIRLPALTHYPDINEGKPTCRKVDKIGSDKYVLRFGDDFKESCVRTFGQMQKYLATKLVLSSDPSTDPNFVALLIHGRWRRLAVCRFGDDAWTPVKYREFRNFYMDALFYKGKFYIVCGWCLYVLNLGKEPELERVPMANPPFDVAPVLPEIHECYLYESGGELSMIHEYYPHVLFKEANYMCEIFMVDWGMHRIKLIRCSGASGRLLLVGRNESIAFSRNNLPKAKLDLIRVCDFEDGNHNFLYNFFSPEAAKEWRQCAWFMPSLL